VEDILVHDIVMDEKYNKNRQISDMCIIGLWSDSDQYELLSRFTQMENEGESETDRATCNLIL